MSDDKERHTFDLDPDASGRWVTRPEGEDPPSDSWAEMTVDIGDPHDRPSELTTPESFVEDPSPPRQAEVVVGDFEEVLDMLYAADRLRARLMRRDLRWINQIVKAAGMRLVLVRKAREND